MESRVRMRIRIMFAAQDNKLLPLLLRACAEDDHDTLAPRKNFLQNLLKPNLCILRENIHRESQQMMIKRILLLCFMCD
jgi:hypothetical protein